MKKKISKSQMGKLYKGKIISTGYCNLQFLLNGIDPLYYSTRREGWACDYYKIPRGIIVCTGYDPIEKGASHISYDFARKYDEAAQKICYETYDWQERKRRLDALLEDFAGDVEQLYLKEKE